MTHLARMGDLEDQATPLFREASELATRSGDAHIVSQVLASGTFGSSPGPSPGL
jgi:hypothetical protein